MKIRSKLHRTTQCRYTECKAKINPSNAATNFTNPVLSVKIAVEREKASGLEM